ncbi:unnamed protein product [Clonostachys rosea f. rosea IK726]|uniref:Uncharacterized protein n=1 Tax=Clonostachys rosea f. rosea IK726 TaxID=1349383 RepID=A0ACA9UJR7_BIOOC|nr:unnamed protein product [Clonostachys rosea f. rosea IK726]
MSQNKKSEDGRSVSSGSTTDQSTAGGSDAESPSPSFVTGQMFQAISLASIARDESVPRTMTEEGHFRAFGFEAEMKSWAHGAFLPSSELDLHMKIWDDLATQIQFFVKLVFPPRCIWSLVEDDIKAQLLAISPRAADFCEDPEYKGCWLLFGAWIWRILYENLFSLNCRDKWSGSDWTTFGCLRESLGEHMETESNAKTHAYHTGRYNLARVIYQRQGPHTCPERLKKLIMLAIKPVVVYRYHEDNHVSSPDLVPEYKPPPSKEPFEDALSEMVRLAIEADFNIVASPHDTRIEMHDPETGKNNGFVFKPGPSMEAHVPSDNEYKGMPVDFIVRPMLRTYGQVKRTTPMEVLVNFFGFHGQGQSTEEFEPNQKPGGAVLREGGSGDI